MAGDWVQLKDDDCTQTDAFSDQLLIDIFREEDIMTPGGEYMAKMETIRVGVVGVGRGRSFARGAGPAVGMELVAVCDTWEEKLTSVTDELTAAGKNVTPYTDYEEFLSHDMDAVILANFYHEHAPFAVKALESGRHVMSECAACHTLAEGVALIRAVERTGKTYMFAENYPYMVFNQEMRRLYERGDIGEFMYGEGEYVHPSSAREKLGRSCGMDHWRNWIPATYYCTHSLAPVMYITDTRPVKVNGFVVPYNDNDPTQAMHVRRSDTAGLIVCRMDNDAVVKSLHGGLKGHQNWVRIHGTLGLMENCRHGDKRALRVHKEPFDKKAGEPVESIYTPDFPQHHKEATAAGHGGGDFFTNFAFAEAIRSDRQPYLDVYRGVEMSIVGILAYRSALDDSAPVAVPNFREESVRGEYENDHWSPDPARAGDGQPLPSVLGHIEPSDEAKRYAREVWKEAGYTEE